MQTFAHFALPAAMVAGALGAIVLCVVLLLYGFASTADDEPRFASRRLFVIRIGHALAATCFALVVMLTGVAFLGDRGAEAPSSAEVETLQARVRALEQRPQPVDARGAAMREQPAALDTRLSALSPEPAPPPARRPVAARRVAATTPAPPPAEPAFDLRAKLSSDWQIIKRGFRDAGDDIKTSFKRTFGSD